uniref:exportin-5-like n=1 Tax=Myxine glutinosa TaxID=7769 RepID=UPI00358EC39E
MQSFLTTLYDTCCHVLGNAGLSLGQEFYKVPRLAESMLDTAWRHLDALPDYRLRSFIKSFLKPFVLNCPAHGFVSVLQPLLPPFMTFMMQSLMKKWQAVEQQATESNPEAEQVDNVQEILDTELTRLLTRDYFDLLWYISSIFL